MHTQLNTPVQYFLELNQEKIALNSLLNTQIHLRYTGRIFCVHCGKQTKKSYNQGYCYPCFIRLAQCDLCIIKPQTCHYAQGTCREPDWALNFCFQPHSIYLANSSGIKVGITRQTQLITRWIDQGAVQALPLLKVSSRYLAGLCEVLIARYISDKTNWQAMLKSQASFIDLQAKGTELLALCEADFKKLQQEFSNESLEILNEQVIDIHFPIHQYPKKITTFNLNKNSTVLGTLQGIKGQYLILDNGVINIRKYSGYEIELITEVTQ